MAAREEAEDREEGVSQSIGASIREMKKAARPTKMTYARPERPEGGPAKPKKVKKAAFDKEMGVAGGGQPKGEKREGKRERALSRGENPDAEKKKKQKLGRMGPKVKKAKRT